MSKNLIQTKVKDGNIEIPMQVRDAIQITNDSDVVIEYDGDGAILKISTESFAKRLEKQCKELGDLYPDMTEEKILEIVTEARKNRTEEEVRKMAEQDV